MSAPLTNHAAVEQGAGSPSAERSGARIAAIIDTNILSGPGRQLAALASGLTAAGSHALILTYRRKGTPESPFVAHLTAQGIPHAVIPEAGPFDLHAVRQLAAALRRFHPDIVQTHSYKATAHAWLLRRLGAQWRWIGFSHGTTAEDRKATLYHLIDHRLIRAADRIVVVSEAQLQTFRGVQPRVRVIDNAVVPLQVTHTAAEGLPTQANADGPRLGIVGRLSSEKGVDVFLQACALLLKRAVRFSAVVAGDGPERRRLEALSAELGLTHRVAFLGQVGDLANLYRSLDLLVIASRREGLPNVLLEALASDVPVVATRVGAIPHVIDDPLVGAIVDPESSDGLAQAIEAALQLKTEPSACRARARVVARFSLARRVAEHRKLYAEVMSVTPGGAS